MTLYQSTECGGKCGRTMVQPLSPSPDYPFKWKCLYCIWSENKDSLNDELVMDMWRTGPPPATGQFQRYPSRFWFNFKKRYPIEDKKVLHMFSGSMDWGDTTDIRPETGAMIVAPYDELPIPDETYDIVAADPAYNKGFASEWITHAKHLPKPKRILIEAARVTKPGGIIAILHIITIPQYPKTFKDLGRPGVRCIGRHGILCGSNNAIRLLNVFRKLSRIEMETE